MDQSPKGRDIEHVDGVPGDIIARGQTIEQLGQQMHDAATTLEQIKNEAVGDGSQKGKAIDALKDSIGDSYSTLRQAGDLYEPVGPVIQAYGQALESAQPTINSSADACEDKWATYESLPGDADGSTTPEAGGGFMGHGGHDADSPEAKKDADQNAAKKAAYDDWHDSAEAFDGGYDTWEDAFDTAVSGIEDKMAGSIKDSFWDNISSFVSIVGTILSWAALVVGVIAIFCTGLGELAAILAIASFLVTALQFANGDKSLTDLGLAALSIIPVGKITSMTKLAQFPKLARGAGGLGNAVSRTFKAVDKGPIGTILAKGGREAFALKKGPDILAGLVGPTLKSSKTDLIKMYIGNRSVLQSSLSTVRGLSKIDYTVGKLSTLSGHYGRVGTVLGQFNINVPSVPPILDSIVS